MATLRRRVLALLLLASLLCAGSASIQREAAALAGGIGPQTTTLAYPEPPVLASAVAVMDLDSGKWLRLYHADRPLPMASTTKIMTAVLAIEHGHLQDLVRVSKAAATVGETTMGLEKGERISMTYLLYGLLIPSGNDAAIAIAEHVAGSVPKFVAMMNARAHQLHLTHTHYVNPYGFTSSPDGDDPAHYTSAGDLVTLARYAMRYPLFRKIVSTQSFVVPATKHNREHDLETVNYFIQWYPGADGIKPGWTSGAGICQVIDVTRDGHHIMAAILNTPNLFTDARDLMNYALHDFTWVPSGHTGDTPDQVVISGPRSNPLWYFPYSGHSVNGAFLSYFRKHGGFAALGAPYTEAVDDDGTLTQFFSAQQLVYEPFAHTVAPVLLGFAAIPQRSWLVRVAKVKNSTSSRYYPQTGHTVTNRFLEYYLAEGGPATFGYPITQKREQGGKLVQYFEYAELVWSAGPDDPEGYVYAGPLGIRSLVTEGLILGDNLPPALHTPMALPSPTARIAIGPRPIATAKPVKPAAGPQGSSTPSAAGPTRARASATPSRTSPTPAGGRSGHRDTPTPPPAIVAPDFLTPVPSATPSVTARPATASPALPQSQSSTVVSSSTASTGAASATAAPEVLPATATAAPATRQSTATAS